MSYQCSIKVPWSFVPVLLFQNHLLTISIDTNYAMVHETVAVDEASFGWHCILLCLKSNFYHIQRSH